MSKNNKARPVLMLQDGKLLADYINQSDASEHTKVSQSYISKLIRSGKTMKCGLSFIYDESVNLGEV